MSEGCDKVVDARHLICPMPIIRIQQAISDMQPGEKLQVLCTDRGVRYDIPAWLRVHGHRLVSSNCELEPTPEEIEFIIEVIGKD